MDREIEEILLKEEGIKNGLTCLLVAYKLSLRLFLNFNYQILAKHVFIKRKES